MKKPLLLLVLALLAASPLAAQEFRCESFGTTTDHTAAGTVYDLNGNPCALLRIVSKDKGCRFEGNIVGEPTFTGDGYLLHVPGRTRRITVLHDDYLPYVYQIGKIVRPDSVYELRLGTQPLPVDPASIREPAMRFRSFETRATDLAAKLNPVYDEQQEPCALIRVCVVCKECDFDGNIVGEPTFSLNRYSVYVPAGTQRITVLHPGFEPFDFDFDREIEKNLTYELTLYALIPEGFDAADARRRQEREFKELLRAAEAGDAGAQYETGNCCMQGRGTAKNSAKAVEWFRASAGQGCAQGQRAYGECWYNGQGLMADQAEGLKWIIKAAEQGDAEAQYDMGCVNFERDHETIEHEYSHAFEWFSKAAEQGHAKAQNSLGLCYESGRGVKRDYSLAVKWYASAAKQGSNQAHYNLGMCYYQGKGVPTDYSEAIRLLRVAAESGLPKAQSSLGVCYYYGHGVAKDYNIALELIRKAAEQGEAEAQNNLGRAYFEGHALEKDYEEAVFWFRKAGEQGLSAAQYNLGVCYTEGYGCKTDTDEAYSWLLKAANRGHADAQYRIGAAEWKSGNRAWAIQWYQQAAAKGQNEALKTLNKLGIDFKKDWSLYEKLQSAAEQGDAEAQYRLGMCYLEGRGIPKQSVRAREWFYEAARQGHAEAQYELGRNKSTREDKIFWYMAAVRQDHEKAKAALKSFGYDYEKALSDLNAVRMAAEQGDPIAQYQLGRHYLNEENRLLNDGKAAKWFLAAAKQGNAEAQYALSECYAQGRGVARNKEQSHFWFQKAAKSGHPEAKKKIQKEENKRTQYEKIRKEAEQGDAISQFYLGEFYFSGFGTLRNIPEAIKWYQEAAKNNDPDSPYYAGALYHLGLCYSEGRGVEKSVEKAIALFQEAEKAGSSEAWHKLTSFYELKAKAGDADAQYTLGRRSKDRDEARSWFFEAAQQGNKKAIEALKELHIDYYKCDQENKAYRQAAEQGDAKAQTALGYRYLTGQKINRDYNKAVKWFQMAATQNYAAAQFYLGYCYYKGAGIDPSYAEAIKWYLQSADQNFTDAQMALGRCYEKGTGVPKNLKEAKKWYTQAYKQAIKQNDTSTKLQAKRALDSMKH